MGFYSDVEERKKNVRVYLRNHPKATFREIKKNLGTKINKVYSGGMQEAYEDAGVQKPRTLKFKTKEEKIKILFDYIRKNPNNGGQLIRKHTKINFSSIFKDTEEMYIAAGVNYPRKDHRQLVKREADTRRAEIINLLKKNPLLGLEVIGKLTHTHPYSLFKDTQEIYRLAGLEFVDGHEKRKRKKKIEAIEFIKKNPFATQREINTACKTHVQLLFPKGIFDAYKEAEVPFPYERLKNHGVMIKEVREKAINFEETIAKELLGYGTVNRLVKTKRGFADIILERKGKKVAIEIKNYNVHEISISQIKQLNRYLEDINSNIGFLVCVNKPKKDTFLIGENRIFILDRNELKKIPELMEGSVV